MTSAVRRVISCYHFFFDQALLKRSTTPESREVQQQLYHNVHHGAHACGTGPGRPVILGVEELGNELGHEEMKKLVNNGALILSYFILLQHNEFIYHIIHIK